MSDYHKSVKQYGPERVSIGYLVTVFKCKKDPNGDPREGGVCRKFRISISEGGSSQVKVDTFSSCADDITNRIVTLIGSTLDAKQTSIDVGGAYFHGTPPSMAEGGRMLFAVSPPWLSHFGPYPATDKHGRKRLLLITGNMPGRKDAGRIWQHRFDKFLTSWGLRQLVTDRRVWIRRTPDGILILHDHVDDTRMTWTGYTIGSLFYVAWAIEFNSPPEPEELSEDFTGLRHQRLDQWRTEILSLGVIKSLEELLIDHPLPVHMRCDCPMPAGALLSLMELPHSKNPLTPELVPVAQQLAGTAGFIATMARPDAYFGYCVIARYVNVQRLTKHGFNMLLRVCHYITRTKEFILTLRETSIHTRMGHV
jgi:hypothetical protein